MERLRASLHVAVDEIVNELAGDSGTARRSEVDAQAIRAGETFGVWRYRWPDGQEEEFTSGRRYEVVSASGMLRLRLAWTTRRAWGRDRERAIVFRQVGGPESTTYYPLTEFVEADRGGQLASSIPDPDRPRALLAAKSQVPDRFANAHVLRADEVFESIENGPSLRLVVAKDDESAMIQHACWVGTIRGRI